MAKCLVGSRNAVLVTHDDAATMNDNTRRGMSHARVFERAAGLDPRQAALEKIGMNVFRSATYSSIV